MNTRFQQHSPAWVNFSYAMFLVSVAATVLGIVYLDIDFGSRGYLLMGVLMIVQTSINVTKTIRDNHEGDNLIRKIEDAKTEKLLLDAESEGSRL